MKSRNIIFLVLFSLFAAQPTFAQLNNDDLITYLKGIVNLNVPMPEMKATLLAKTQPDECYDGIGKPYPIINPDGTCPSGEPKRNQAYLWGMTYANNKLFFGTGPNIMCLAMTPGSGGAIMPSIEAKTLVCEGAQASSGTADHRPPRLYSYDIKTKTLKDITPAETAIVAGIRSAGSLGNIVFLGGPNAIFGGTEAGITIWAFDAATDTLLGQHTFSQFDDIRKWIEVKGVLYTAVKNSTGGGSVLRWRGDINNLWNFEVVGVLPNEGSNITLYKKDRLAVSTWPAYAVNPLAKSSGIYLSPQIPTDGLTNTDSNNWKEVFSYSSYEPDPIWQKITAGGDLAYYDGWLYWGSMHAPGTGIMAHMMVYGANQAAKEDLFLGTWRAASLWRGKNLETDNPKIELLYGEKELPVYDFDLMTQQGTKKFVMKPTGWKPKYGKAGFGNMFNTYVWTMAVANKSLFVGTLDVSYTMATVPMMGLNFSDMVPIPEELFGFLSGYGADMWRFDSSKFRPLLENRSGLTNKVNYGIRTMTVHPNGKTIYVGTANPYNLDPKGGWELIQLKPRY